VQIQVNTAYDDSPESLALLQALAKYAPARSITVRSGETISQLFVGEYGFGPSDLPKSYQILIAAILARNNLARAEDLHPGTLVIPAVPRRVLMGFNPSNLFNAVANRTTFSVDDAISSWSVANRDRRTAEATTDLPPSELAYKRSTLIGTHRQFAPSETLAFSLPILSAKELADSKEFPQNAVTVSAYSLPVKLADDTLCDTELPIRDHKTLSAAQKSVLAQTLATQTKRTAVVFILDTGWPSLASYQDSRSALYQILTAIWQSKFGRAFATAPPMTSIPAAGNDHCRCIDRALKELQTLAPAPAMPPVKLIYIPLTREQGANTILADLLQTSSLLQQLQSGAGQFDQATIDASRKAAEELVSTRFPAAWTSEQIVTDKSLLDAVLWIGRAYSQLNNTLFIANESWTVSTDGPYYVQYQAPQYGIVTAATGNDPNAKLMDFAQRSTSALDTMAIFSLNKVGVVEPQSTMPVSNNLDLSIAAGFDGYVTDDIWGTSFAAPRVAWFLAAGEAVRIAPLDPNSWAGRLKTQIWNFHPDRSGYSKLFFDPVWYVQTQAGQPYQAASSAP
jgi:hypothetical protein